MILNDLRSIESDLSPENLYQDGMRSKAKANILRKRWLKERAALVKNLGREPTMAEIWDVR